MKEIELVQAVVADVAAGFAAGNANPVVSIATDGLSVVLTMTPTAPQSVVKTYPVVSPNEPA